MGAVEFCHLFLQVAIRRALKVAPPDLTCSIAMWLHCDMSSLCGCGYGCLVWMLGLREVGVVGLLGSGGSNGPLNGELFTITRRSSRGFS
jgi:hypothetical protein